MNDSKSPPTEKICLACLRPFVWRKKWQREWDNVRISSDRPRPKKP
ncbi:DUF2256 domain-containing protein [uncultured Ferrimonas sp.]|nr:DUF2256 domain-containing protein [uncultured Ferrimonas sp.]